MLQAYYQLNQYVALDNANATSAGLISSGLGTNETEATALSSVVDEGFAYGNVENDVNMINKDREMVVERMCTCFLRSSSHSSMVQQQPNKVTLAPILSSEAEAIAKQQLKSREDNLSVELSRMLKSGGSFLCDNCSENNAEFYCLQCPADCSKYCQACAKSHRSLKMFRSHVVQVISELIPSPKTTISSFCLWFSLYKS